MAIIAEGIDTIKKNISNKTKLIYVENPGSNTFEFQDLNKILSIAKTKKVYTAIDNTWGTPYFLRPIKLGFDLSIVSATKYYSGHSDVMGGTLAVSKRVFRKVLLAQNMTGLRLSPDDAYFIMRGLRTLDVRLDRHEQNTNLVVKFLSKKKNVEVLYPYKKNSKNFKILEFDKTNKSSYHIFALVFKSLKMRDKFILFMKKRRKYKVSCF